MFKKGSRYFNLPQSRHLTAAGERPLSADVRFIDPVPGQFLHTVSARERLDLLAFRYYNDPRKWWLIADANPNQPFPIDLLDTAPLVEEELTLEHPGYLERIAKLVFTLQSFGSAVEGPSDLFAAGVTVNYTAATTRSLITGEITRLGFHLTDSVEWSGPAGTTESFTFEDREVKRNWNALVTSLGLLPGLLEMNSVSAGSVIHIEYNELQLSRETIQWAVENRGFVIVPQQSQRVDRLGARIMIPPNQA